MRTAAFGATLMIALAACSTTSSEQTDSPYAQPNQLMATEITRRVEQIPYLHREELVENLLWLAQAGEQAVPALLDGLRHESAKVRSSSAWVLGRIRDRRTIPNLQAAVNDREATVRFECARSLVLLGDLANTPVLIEGLDSERKEVRYLCHEALKTATGHDFGYDHLAASIDDMRGSVLRWRQWWGEYSGDAQFAMSYQRRYGVGMPAAPAGETQQVQEPEPQSQQQEPKPVPPTTAPTSTEQSKTTPAKVEQPNTEQSKVEPIRTEQPKVEAAEKPIILPVVPPKPTGSGSKTTTGEVPVIEISGSTPGAEQSKPTGGAGDQAGGPGGALPPGIVPITPAPSATPKPAPKPVSPNGGQ